jgi:xyloglucan fucosyltransferase
MDDASSHGHGAARNATEGKPDVLLGGLLTPGMDRRSCRSRYELWRYYKQFPHAPSPQLLRALGAYEARHRRCAPGTPLYAEAVEQLRSGRSGSDAAECRYIVWLPFDGLGNRMLSMASGFLYALLTGRVFLVALPPDSADLFCEPFPGTTWQLPHKDFPVANLFGLGASPEASYTSLLKNKKIPAVVDDDDTTAWPAYVYLSLGWQLTDRLFFCAEHQRAIGKVSWLLLYSDLYFVPSLYAVTGEFRDELRLLFPEKEAASHLLLRYLFHPSNAVWGLVTRYYHSYLAPATKRIGVQIRMFGFGSIPVDDMYNQILACSRQERILPETEDGGGDDDAAAVAETDTGNKTTAIMIASLYADYYERLRARYYEHAAASDGGVWVGVFQPTHEERQATENLAHNQRALAEVYLLSFSEDLLTSGMSTFGYVSSSLAGVRPTILLTAHGHKVPKPPCRRAVSMEPCNLTPPRGDECRAAKHGKDGDLARHVRACEDAGGGVKFFD